MYQPPRNVPTGRYVSRRLVRLSYLMQVTSTFRVITQPLPTAEKTTIPNLKEEKQGFHMSPIAEILIGKIAFKSSD